MPATKYTPAWKRYEKGMYDPDPKVQREATEKFTAAREEELRTSPQARRWEESRKESAVKDKPGWVKDRQKVDPIQKFRDDLKKAGHYPTGLKPAPGFVIVEIEIVEAKTSGGIYLTPDASKINQNVGIVLDIGEPPPFSDNRDLPLPCRIGDKVMFKKGAGLEMGIAERDCRFMLQSEILGTFYEES